MGRRVYLDGDFLGDNFLGEKLKELFFFAGAGKRREPQQQHLFL